MKPFNQCRRWAVMTLFAGTNLVILLAGESPVFFPAQAAAPPKTTTDDAPLRRDNPPTVSYASVVKKVSPSVVNIYTSKTLRFSLMKRELDARGEQKDSKCP